MQLKTGSEKTVPYRIVRQNGTKEVHDETGYPMMLRLSAAGRAVMPQLYRARSGFSVIVLNSFPEDRMAPPDRWIIIPVLRRD